MSLELAVIVASTRPGRVGIHVGRWIEGVARAHGRFEVRLADLAEVGLPLFDEPRHPSRREYEHAHTKRWSAIVDAADAFVLVMPEYNNSPTPALTNALDFLYHEWAYKPAGLVSYGGISGGLRAAQAVKLTLLTLRVVPIVEAVVIPRVSEQVADGAFTPKEAQAKGAAGMLDALVRWAEALRPLRG